MMQETIRILIIGQSNAFGSGSATDSGGQAWLDSFPDKTHEDLYVWDTRSSTGVNSFGHRDGTGSFQIWDLSLGPDQWQHDEADRRFTHSMGFSMGKRIQELTGARVEVIVAAIGGQPIQQFLPGGSVYAQLQGRLANSGWPSSSVNRIIFMQGENDNGSDDSTYGGQFDQFRSTLSTFDQIDDQTPMSVVELIDGPLDARNSYLQTLPERTDYRFSFLETGNLPSRGDSIHYSNDSLEIIGKSHLAPDFFRGGSYVIFEPTLKMVSVSNEGNDAVVSFNGSILESSLDLETWTPITGATSPHTEPMTSPQKFYRSK